MPNATIAGKKPDSLPAVVKQRINEGYPKRTAQSLAPLPRPTVKVK